MSLFQYKKYMNKKEVFEYIRTILISLLIALVIASVATAFSKVIAEHHIKMLPKIANTAKDDEILKALIKKFTELSDKNPGDYVLNVKLGNLYELMLDEKNALRQYKNAINKAPYGVYSPYFGLANLYLKQGKYKEALAIVKKLKNTDHKPLLVAKGDFYMNLGDLLWQDNHYEQSVKQYKVAYFYYKKVDSEKKDSAIIGILDCYNKIADEDFKKHKIKAAIESLETALLYKETPIVYYKLAILYKDVNPIIANSYMEKTYKMDPGLINFDIYEEILIKLIRYYYLQSQDIKTELYHNKLKAIKNFEKRYVITPNDIKINIKKLRVKNNLLHSKQTIQVKFNIENTSKSDFNTLFITTNLKYDHNSKTIYSEKLYSKKKPLKSRAESEEYSFKYTYSDKDEIFSAKDLELEFYVSKKDNMRKIPVKSVKIERF